MAGNTRIKMKNIELLLDELDELCSKTNAPELLKKCISDLINGDDSLMKEICPLLHWLCTGNMKHFGEFITIIMDARILMGEKTVNTIHMMAEETDRAYNPKRRGDRLDVFNNLKLFDEIMKICLERKLLECNYSLNEGKGNKNILAGVMFICFRLKVFKHINLGRKGRNKPFTLADCRKWCMKRFSLKNFDQMKPCHEEANTALAREHFPELVELEEKVRNYHKF